MAVAKCWANGVAVETQDIEFDDAPSTTRHRQRPVSFTAHARRRGARRNVAPDAVDYVLAHGRMIQRTGVTFFYLARRDMPPADHCASWASRLEGSTVLLAPDGVVVTVYRNRHGLRAILRKPKHRVSGINRRPDDADVRRLDEAQSASA